MSDLLFQRSAALTIQPVNITKDDSGKVTVTTKNNGIKVEGLTIDFQVTKTSESNANTAKINVLNMNESSRSLLEDNDTVVKLEVGYQGDLETLFIGDVKRAENNRTREGWNTMIECGDGERNITESTINISMGPGTTLQQVISKLTDQLGVTIGSIEETEEGKFNQGVTLAGSVSKLLDKTLSKVNLEWSVQDGVLQVIRPTEDTGITGLLLSPKTGLLGAPAKKEKAEIKFTSLLIPSLKPGQRVVIESERINGDYRIRKADYRGNTRSQAWQVECEAVEVATAEIVVGMTPSVV